MKHIRASVGVALVIASAVQAQDPSASNDTRILNLTGEGLEYHRKSYILLGSWDRSLRDRPSPVMGGKNEEVEIKFQLSVRYPFAQWNNEQDHVFFAYTATSFWQVYDTNDSSPFRTTDHEPELFWERECTAELSTRVGVVHESNGESGIENRSWNRLYVEGLYTGSEGEPDGEGAWGLLLKAWHVFGEATENDDIKDFMGPFELWGEYSLGTEEEPRRFSAMLRNNLWLDDDNRGAFELNYTHGYGEHVRILFQYFNGYGESLLDYDENANRFGIGLEFSS